MLATVRSSTASVFVALLALSSFDQLSNVFVGDAKLIFLSVFTVPFRHPKILVDFHHAFSRTLVNLLSLNVDAEPFDDGASQVVQDHDFVLLFVNLKDSTSVSGMMQRLGFSAGIGTVYSFSGVISVFMSDVTMSLLFPPL